MDTSSLGPRLRHERETRGVSLEVLSRATRIPVRLLEALEDERWDELPGGVFNRGFVRAISEYLGLDADDSIAAYVAATNDAPRLRRLETEAQPPHWPGLWLAAAAAILILVVVAGGWMAFRHFRPQTRIAATSHLMHHATPATATMAPSR